MFVLSLSFALSAAQTTSVPAAAQTTSYQLIEEGKCQDTGLAPVTTTGECEAAAHALGLADTTVGTTNTVARPEGCYVIPGQTNMLFFAYNGILGANGPRKPVCRSGPAPVPAPDARRFQMITQGTCASHGFRVVESVPDCGVAAQFLNLTDQTVGTSTQTARPEGCYFTDGSQGLWFAHNGNLGFSCCAAGGASRKPVCEMPKMTWEIVRETAIADTADLVACVSHSGDIRTNLAAIEDCMAECEMLPACVAITTTSTATTLKQAATTLETNAAANSYVLTRVWLDQQPNDFESLTPCISHENVDIRADDAKISECMTECQNTPDCVGVVAHPWGALLTADSTASSTAGTGFDLYFVERATPDTE